MSTQRTDTSTDHILPGALAPTGQRISETAMDHPWEQEGPRQRSASWQLEWQSTTGLELRSNEETRFTAGVTTLSDPRINAIYPTDSYVAIRSELDMIHHKSRMARYDALTDPVALFILKTLVDADGLSITDLDDLLANGRGWARIIRLVQAGLVDLAGDYIEITRFGHQAYLEANELSSM